MAFSFVCSILSLCRLLLSSLNLANDRVALRLTPYKMIRPAMPKAKLRAPNPTTSLIAPLVPLEELVAAALVAVALPLDVELALEVLEASSVQVSLDGTS